MYSFSIIVPAFNEEQNLPDLLDSLIELGKKSNEFEIIVVDDNSIDKTAEIAKNYSKKFKNVKVFCRKSLEHGMGAALKDGTSVAFGEKIVWVMADKSDDLNKIPQMVEKIDEGFDIVFGSRYMPGGNRGELSIDKALYSFLYSSLCRIVFGIPVHDITNAFRCFKKNVFEVIPLESNDFAISPEFAIKAQLKGFKLGEIPTTYFKRTKGKAKFDFLKMGLKYASLFKYRLIKF